MDRNGNQKLEERIEETKRSEQLEFLKKYVDALAVALILHSNLEYSREINPSRSKPREGEFQIFIKEPDNKTITLICSTGDSVQDIRRKLQEKIGLDLGGTTFTFGSKQLRDDMRIKDYGVTENSTIFVNVRDFGGSNEAIKSESGKIKNTFRDGSVTNSNNSAAVTKSQIYSSFKENDATFAKVKSKIMPNYVYELYTDGTAKGNPGMIGVGYVLYDKNKNEIYSNLVHVGSGTNNQAEYYGIIFGLKSSIALGVKKISL